MLQAEPLLPLLTAATSFATAAAVLTGLATTTSLGFFNNVKDTTLNLTVVQYSSIKSRHEWIRLFALVFPIFRERVIIKEPVVSFTNPNNALSFAEWPI
jgi:hypothetical protein